jgi:hypothetical protein
MEISPLEAHVGYLLTAAFVVLVVCVVAGAMHVRHENRTTEPPRPAGRRRVVRRTVPRSRCRCGGTVRTIPDPSGDLLGCTACHRRWTMGGHRITKIIRR